MKEVDRQRSAFRELMAPWVAEEVVCAEQFWPPRGTKGDGNGAAAWVRRRLRSGDHPDGRLKSFNILVLTPTRLVAFAGRHFRGTPSVEPKEEIGAWPLGEVSLRYRGRKREAFFASIGNTYTSKVVRATLTLAGTDRPLVADFPETPLARELLKSISERIGTPT